MIATVFIIDDEFVTVQGDALAACYALTVAQVISNTSKSHCPAWRRFAPGHQLSQ